MIERQFVAQNMKEYMIQDYISKHLTNVGLSHTKLVKTPAGVKIIIYASRPGLIVGKKGANIKELTDVMKNKFKLENPQVEIAEVENINLDPQIVAEKIVSTIERFGTQRFKGIAHKVMADVINSGARGIEITISGKIPGARAKSWRFYAGYLKKCGDIAVSGVKKAVASAEMKTGTVGVKVSIMPPDIRLPDDISIYDEKTIEEHSVAEKKAQEEAEQKKGKRKTKRKEESKEREKQHKEKQRKEVQRSEEKKNEAKSETQ
jgi:small subunit ribosomal protein S3